MSKNKKVRAGQPLSESLLNSWAGNAITDIVGLGNIRVSRNGNIVTIGRSINERINAGATLRRFKIVTAYSDYLEAHTYDLEADGSVNEGSDLIKVAKPLDQRGSTGPAWAAAIPGSKNSPALKVVPVPMA